MKKVNLIWGVITATIFFFLILTPAVLLACLLSFGNTKKRISYIMPGWNIWGHLVMKISCMAHVYREDERTIQDKGKRPHHGLYICNHMSFIDIPLNLLHFQIPPIMKKQILYIPFFGFLGWASGSLIVDRSSKSSRKETLKKAIHRLVDQNIALQYYPEGTRSKIGRPKEYSEIKDALLRIAYKKNIPVFPVSIYGTHNMLKDGLKLFQNLGLKNHAKVDPKDFSSSEEFSQYCWKVVSDGHFYLKEKCNQSNDLKVVKNL